MFGETDLSHRPVREIAESKFLRRRQIDAVALEFFVVVTAIEQGPLFAALGDVTFLAADLLLGRFVDLLFLHKNVRHFTNDIQANVVPWSRHADAGNAR